MRDSIPLRIGAGVVLTLGLLTAYRIIHNLTGGFPEDFGFSDERYLDVTLLYSILPGYFLAMTGVSAARARAARLCFSSDVSGSKLAIFLVALVGLIYGVLDFRLVEDPEISTRVLEWTLRIGSGFLWVCVGAYAGWRVSQGVAMARAGHAESIKLWQRDHYRPVARMATLDVFVTMGALALMPLQSLSSTFQWVYYRPGLVVGIPMAILLLLLPLLGIRAATARSKANELDAVNREVAAYNGDRVGLELLLAHRDRIATLSPWPLDMRLLSRALFYLVIPPAAWVGAALVERLVEQVI